MVKADPLSGATSTANSATAAAAVTTALHQEQLPLPSSQLATVAKSVPQQTDRLELNVELLPK